jgi:adenosylcobinamide-GDP ribazoletransferase
MVDALQLLTLLPRSAARYRPNRATLLFFPVVGLLIGICWAVPGFLIGQRVSSAGVTAALVLIVDALVTRGMHLDALADVADGAASGRRDDEGIAIMRDPTIGAMGAAALVLLCLLRYGALTFSSDFGFRLFAAPVAGRAAMVMLITWLVPRQDGSLPHLLERPHWLVVVGAAVLSVACVLPSGPRGITALMIALVVTVVYGGWWQGRFGELNSDGVGAGALLAETAALLAMSTG